MRIFFDYILFLLRSKNRHGVHSPFVYKFNEDILNKPLHFTFEKEVETCRGEFLVDNSVVEDFNFGAGNRKKGKKKTIASIAKNSLKPSSQAKLLAMLAQYNHSKNILELGSCLGITAVYLALGNPNARVISIDASSTMIKKSEMIKEKLNCQNLRFINQDFDFALKELEIPKDGFDFVFIDGNHSKEATLRYFHFFKSKMSENGLLVFDDIYWSKGMKEAWKSIKEDSNTRLSIDIFYFGIISFSNKFSKENFTLRSKRFF